MYRKKATSFYYAVLLFLLKNSYNFKPILRFPLTEVKLADIK